MRTKMTYTKGEWNIQKTMYNEDYIINQNEQIKSIASVRTKSNARLISASPDLLKACKEALEFFPERLDKSSQGYLLRRKLENAITKAEGN